MALSDLVIRAAKPADKNYRLYDSLGLYVEIATGGGKWWRLKYSFDGKEKRLSLGVYPKVGLKNARRPARLQGQLRRQVRDASGAVGVRAPGRTAGSCRRSQAFGIHWTAKLATFGQNRTDIRLALNLIRFIQIQFPCVKIYSPQTSIPDG